MKKLWVVVGTFTLIGLIYGGYRKGYSDGVANVTAVEAIDYTNDWKDDPSLKHSVTYSLAYKRGYEKGKLAAHYADLGDTFADVLRGEKKPKAVNRELVIKNCRTLPQPQEQEDCIEEGLEPLR